jgi:hypothetical protein
VAASGIAVLFTRLSIDTITSISPLAEDDVWSTGCERGERRFIQVTDFHGPVLGQTTRAALMSYLQAGPAVTIRRLLNPRWFLQYVRRPGAGLGVTQATVYRRCGSIEGLLNMCAD